MSLSTKNRLAGASPLLTLLVPCEAHALEMEYYTYGGFDAVVDAFQRTALIFSDHRYLTLFFSFAVLGIVAGGFAWAGRTLVGGQVNILGWFVPVLAGVVVLQGLILPKGTLHIYDPVKNGYQPVGDIPDAVVALAGGLNKIERVMVAIVDTASAYPYASEAGGITYDLIFRATGEWVDVDASFTSETLTHYFVDCGTIALRSSGYNVNLNMLKRDTTNLMDILARFRSASLYTLWFDANYKAGLSVTCAEAWDGVADSIPGLRTVLSAADLYIGLTNGICAKAGFNPNDPNQRTQCRALLARANDALGLASGGYDDTHFIRNAYLAQTIGKLLESGTPDDLQQSLANRELVVKGFGIAQTANHWLPTVRASVTSIAIGITPFLVLFVVTPLLVTALRVQFGLLAWLSLWGMADAVTHQISIDQAHQIFARIADWGMGLDALWGAPSAALEALSMFGYARGMSIMIATFLAAMLFKFSSYAFANTAERYADRIEAAGGEAGMSAATPEGRAGLTQTLAHAMGTEATLRHQGIGNMGRHDAFQQGKAVGASVAELEGGAAEGYNQRALTDAHATIGGGSSLGTVKGSQSIARQLGMSVSHLATRTSETEQALRTGGAQANRDAITGLGNDPNLAAGVLQFSAIESLQRYANDDEIGHIVEGIRHQHWQNTGEVIDTDQGYQQFAQLMNAQTRADAKAFGDDPGSLADMLYQRRTYEYGKVDAMVETAAKFNTTVQDLGRAESLLEGAHSIGALRTLDEIPQQALAAYHAFTIGQTGHQGRVWEAIAEREGGEQPALRALAETQMGRIYGPALVAERIAEGLGGTILDAQLAREGAHIAVGFTAEQAGTFVPWMEDNGARLNPDARAAMMTHGGTTTITLADGELPSVSGNAGSQFAYNRTASVDTSTSLEGGQRITETSVRDALLGNIPVLTTLVGNTFGTDAEQSREVLLNQVSGLLSQFGATSVTKSEVDSLFVQGTAGVSIPRILPFGAGAQISKTHQENTSEEETFNGNLAITHAIFDRINAHAEQIAEPQATALSLDPQHYQDLLAQGVSEREAGRQARNEDTYQRLFTQIRNETIATDISTFYQNLKELKLEEAQERVMETDSADRVEQAARETDPALSGKTESTGSAAERLKGMNAL